MVSTAGWTLAKVLLERAARQMDRAMKQQESSEVTLAVVAVDRSPSSLQNLCKRESSFMPGSFYFQVTLEPHLKHSGVRTGRKILFLVEIPRELVPSQGQESADELRLQDDARRLAAELAPLAMSGRPRAAGEDNMTVSCQPASPSADMLERLPDVEKGRARAWLLGSVPA